MTGAGRFTRIGPLCQYPEFACNVKASPVWAGPLRTVGPGPYTAAKPHSGLSADGFPMSREWQDGKMVRW